MSNQPMSYKPGENFLNNKIIMVTGASDGIGKAVAMQYAKYGATVILVGRSQQKLEAVYDAIESAGCPQPALLPINFEVATPKDYADLANLVENEFGRLDGLVINAGWLGTQTPVSHYDAETWFRVMQVNLNAPFMLVQYCLDLLKKADNPAVIFTLDEKSEAYWGAYGVSKAGLTSLMKILADELDTETNRVRINAVQPTAVRTSLRSRAYPGEDPNSLPTPDEISIHYLQLMDDDYTQTGTILSL